MPETTPCKACGKPIRWVKTPAGKRMPLDPEPCEGGNVGLSAEGVAYVLGKGQAARCEGWPLYKCHFVTCPEAARFRKR